MQGDRLGDLPPTVYSGLSEVIGSWKIIEMALPRMASISPSLEIQEVLAVEADGSADDPTWRIGDQAQDRQRRHALAAARLPQPRPGLAALQGIGNSIDRAHGSNGREEMRLEILYLKYRSCRQVRQLTDGARPRLDEFKARLPENCRASFGLSGRQTKTSQHKVIGLEKTKWEENADE